MRTIAFGLFLIFVAAKIMHYIDWSWWWVASPLIFYFLFLSVLTGVAVWLGYKLS